MNKRTIEHSACYATRRNVLPLLVLLCLTACSRVTIHDLLENPRQYDDKVVTISGTVTDRTSVLVTNYFTLKDQTGEIRVFTDRPMPSVGSTVEVKGHVKQVFAVGSSQLVVFEEEPANAAH